MQSRALEQTPRSQSNTNACLGTQRAIRCKINSSSQWYLKSFLISLAKANFKHSPWRWGRVRQSRWLFYQLEFTDILWLCEPSGSSLWETSSSHKDVVQVLLNLSHLIINTGKCVLEQNYRSCNERKSKGVKVILDIIYNHQSSGVCWETKGWWLRGSSPGLGCRRPRTESGPTWMLVPSLDAKWEGWIWCKTHQHLKRQAKNCRFTLRYKSCTPLSEVKTTMKDGSGSFGKVLSYRSRLFPGNFYNSEAII